MQSTLTARPVIGLQPFVSHYYQREAHIPETIAIEPVPARLQHILEFQFRDRYEIRHYTSDQLEFGPPVAIVGPQTYRRVRLLTKGHVEGFVVVFKPSGFYRLFGVEMSQLVNEAYDARTVIGADISEIWHRLGEAGRFSRRIDIIEQYLSRHRSCARPSISMLTTYISMCRGEVRIEDLAHSAGLSARQIERQFRTQVGLSPKVYARIERFESALRIKAASPEQSWTTIAHELGYYDQMHMVHDFQELSGESPTTTLAQAIFGLSLNPPAWIACSKTD
jgi:AraC-like DNA-binding protein